MLDILHEVMSAPHLPARIPDIELLTSYTRDGCPGGTPIYLSLGETWTEVAPGLAEQLASPLPSHCHGYVLSQFGLPALQGALRTYIPRTHRLGANGSISGNFEVAVACSGTRNNMFDFARMLLLDASDDRAPVVISPAPGWDYGKIFTPLGYRMRYLTLRPQNGFQPEQSVLSALLDSVVGSAEQRLALVVINAQHNPSGTNWHPEIVREMLRAAFSAGAAVLIDDAYFGLHDPAVVPTSALQILLEELARAPREAQERWLAIRSLGKQFNCSGWGIGAVTAHPATLERLMNDCKFQRSFMCAVPLQSAMARWLESTEAERYLEEARRAYASKRDLVIEFLRTELGYPAHAYHRGECTNFLLFQIPRAYAGLPDGAARFRRECFERSGVLLGITGWVMHAESAPGHEVAYVRMFLGPPAATLREALLRVSAAGFRY